MSDQVSAMKAELARTKQQKRDLAACAKFWKGADDLPFRGYAAELANEARYETEKLIPLSEQGWLAHVERMLEGASLVPAMATDGEDWWFVMPFSDWIEGHYSNKSDGSRDWIEGRYSNWIKIHFPGDGSSPSVLLGKSHPFNPPFPENKEHTEQWRKLYGHRAYEHFSESPDIKSILSKATKFYKLNRPMTFRLLSK